MKSLTYYGLSGYLALIHAQHTPLLTGAMSVLAVSLLGRWAWLRWCTSHHPHDATPGFWGVGAPLACIVFGVSLLILPGWRGLDGALNDTELALVAGFFQVRNVMYGRPAGASMSVVPDALMAGTAGFAAGGPADVTTRSKPGGSVGAAHATHLLRLPPCPVRPGDTQAGMPPGLPAGPEMVYHPAVREQIGIPPCLY